MSVDVWMKQESFTSEFRIRMKKMVAFIPDGSSVLDLGCGPMWLKDLLPAGCRYTPVDYINRGPETIICNFNRHEFPEHTADVAFCGGVLEYIEDPQWFISHVADSTRICIISYNTIESLPNALSREKHGWKNSLREGQLMVLFESAGMVLTSKSLSSGIDPFFVFSKSSALMPGGTKS